MKVLIHAQHLSGVGHRVRALELARRLAASHRVVLVDGGRAVPRVGADAVERLALPRIGRRDGVLASLEAGAALGAVLAERRARLVRCATELAPDALVVEHYPFSKWELEGEIAAAVDAARAANAAVRVVCSVRDVCRRTRYEPGGAEAVARRVNAALHARFDAVAVHADPRFTRLEEHFAGAADLALPVFHTGFVSERRRCGAPDPPRSDGGHAVLSVGGGAGSADFALRCIAAWRRLQEARSADAPVLVVFAGLFWTDAELERVRAAVAGGPFLLRPFGVDLLAWLADAALSISRAGYNTCTNLLETGCPALLVPHPQMSDQAFRARRLSELGLASALADDASEAALAEAMGRALRQPRSRHDLDLDGASHSARLLEGLVAAGPDLLSLATRSGRLRDLAPVTALPSPVRRRAAFALDFADGPRRKGRRLRSAERAETVARLLEVAGDGFAPLWARGGDALLLAWVEGPTLDALPRVPAETLRACGERLAALHRLPVPLEVTAPVRTLEVLLARLEADATTLRTSGALEPALARRALGTARAHAPQGPRPPSTGIVHRDYCAENLVLDASGAPVCIDNASLALGCHDLDLARTWARWPMAVADRERFAAGYAERRSLDALLAHFPFWACCVLLGSAAKRVRTHTGREKPPIDGLRRLLGRPSDGSPGDAFWCG